MISVGLVTLVEVYWDHKRLKNKLIFTIDNAGTNALANIPYMGCYADGQKECKSHLIGHLHSNFDWFVGLEICFISLKIIWINPKIENFLWAFLLLVSGLGISGVFFLDIFSSKIHVFSEKNSLSGSRLTQLGERVVKTYP